ncbi:glycosyl hydrolase family 3 C-terminal domain-containing protein [Fusarium sp. MPI-SDFR-AT-0072]|nr:glycosyl hydrolase family 3 C-terminal domain-containing protein [Fusarium sp. MPI-SDFR-AT-0072]
MDQERRALGNGYLDGCLCGKEVRFNNHHPAPGQVIPMGRDAIELGGRPVTEAEEMLQEAERAAREADVAIVAVGLNQDSECEGYDRDSMKLPGKSDELVERVLAANPLTVVILQSGTPVELPWVDHSSKDDIVHRQQPCCYSLFHGPKCRQRWRQRKSPNLCLTVQRNRQDELGAGEKKTCSVQLTMEALAYFDTSANKWTVDAGDYKVLLGSSPRDIKESVYMFIETKASWLEYPKLK